MHLICHLTDQVDVRVAQVRVLRTLGVSPWCPCPGQLNHKSCPSMSWSAMLSFNQMRCRLIQFLLNTPPLIHQVRQSGRGAAAFLPRFYYELLYVWSWSWLSSRNLRWCLCLGIPYLRGTAMLMVVPCSSWFPAIGLGDADRLLATICEASQSTKLTASLYLAIIGITTTGMLEFVVNRHQLAQHELTSTFDDVVLEIDFIILQYTHVRRRHFQCHCVR